MLMLGKGKQLQKEVVSAILDLRYHFVSTRKDLTIDTQI